MMAVFLSSIAVATAAGICTVLQTVKYMNGRDGSSEKKQKEAEQ